ncbi:rRNA (cytosine-N4-)-methyltransferase [Aureococcus anophagefferens]|nr:rRNA (cytosine-N4-)-methyltransferase [Aureococcus anophagefferens]
MAALFDYSRWDNIVDSDDDAPLMAAPAAPEATVDPVARVGAKNDKTSATALSRALALEHSKTTDVAAIAEGLGMAPDQTVASLQDALVKHGAGGQAAVLPLIAEGAPTPPSPARWRARARAATDAASARSAAGTVARTEAKKQLRLARALLGSAGGVDELEDTARAGPGEDLVNVMLRTLEDAETRIAERIVASAAASDEPGEKTREDKARGFCVLDDVLAKEDADAIYDHACRALAHGGLRPARGDDGAAEAPLPVALGLPTIAALDASLFDVFERHEPDDEAAMAYRAAVQAAVGVAYELERGLELDDALAVPDAVRLAAYAPDGSARAKREDWSPYDDADDREVVATLFANPLDWTGRTAAAFSLSCAFDRRAPGYDVDDDDEDEDDATARDPEAFAYELAQKLKDQAERRREAVSATFMGPMYTDLGPSDVTVVEGATPFEPGDHDKENDIGLVASKNTRSANDAATAERVLVKGGTPAGTHVPIMVAECLEHLRVGDAAVAVDCTLGYGGHSTALVARCPAARLGVDRDGEELAKTAARLAEARAASGEVTLEQMHSNYAAVGDELARRASRSTLLADLGCSSMQVDDPERGFTYKREGPLDMRMDTSRGETAADWLARSSTADALRVAVNDEFASLDALLASLPDALAPGGRAVVLTFHSGEDRRVKQAFKKGLAANVYSAVARRPVRASPEERRANSRSGCCKLRWCVRSKD